MLEHEMFARSRENYFMIADRIATAQRMHPDLRPRPFADHPVAPVRDIFLRIQFPHVAQDFGKLLRRSTRRVFL